MIRRRIHGSLLRTLPIRTRLTLWYIVVFSLIMGSYVGVACLLQYSQLNEQLYHAEVQDMETVEGLLYFADDGRLSLHEDYHSLPNSKQSLDRLMEVLDFEGNVLFQNEKLKGMRIGGSPLAQELKASHYARRLQLVDGQTVLAVSHAHHLQGRHILIRLGYSTEPLRVRILELFVVLVLVLPLSLVIAGFTGYRIAGTALKPLTAMALLTEDISASKLAKRIPIRNPNDELGHIARVLNELLARLEESFDKLRRFTSDISTELRTPLSSMRSVGEVGLQQAHSEQEYRDIIGSMLEEVAGLAAMTDNLLTLSHSDSGANTVCPVSFPIMDLVRESVAIFEVLADERKQTILITGDSGVSVYADRELLKTALINLLDNAVKYSYPGTAIHICLNHIENQRAGLRYITLSVQDEGCGIPQEELHRVFERFCRLDQARTREVRGTGLGLAIARWAVQAQGGEIILQSELNRGSVFTIRLPA